jgi:ATP/ADP translocase
LIGRRLALWKGGGRLGYFGILVSLALLVTGVAMLLFAVFFWGYYVAQGGWNTVAMLFMLVLCVACGRWVVRTWKSI